MRVLIDTNVLISAMIWQNSIPATAVFHVAKHHEALICEQSLHELRAIINLKFQKYESDIDAFLSSFRYEQISAKEGVGPHVRDVKDQTIMDAAAANTVDIILTGDNDFLCMDLSYPQCLKPAEYLEKYKQD